MLNKYINVAWMSFIKAEMGIITFPGNSFPGNYLSAEDNIFQNHKDIHQYRYNLKTFYVKKC